MSELIIRPLACIDGNSIEIALAGSLCIENAAELQQCLLAQAPQTGSIRLNLVELEAIDLAGLQVICSACRTMLGAGKTFSFAGKLPDTVKETLIKIGLQRQSTCKHNNELPCIWCGGAQ